MGSSTDELMVDKLMNVIKKADMYSQAGVADKVWNFALENPFGIVVKGEDEQMVPVIFSKPFGVMLPEVVAQFEADPQLSEYFMFSAGNTIALRARFCHKVTKVNDTLSQILCVIRNLPGKPFGDLDQFCDAWNFRLRNGVPQEEYRVPANLAHILGVVTDRHATSVYSETEDGDVCVLVRKMAGEVECLSTLCEAEYLVAHEADGLEDELRKAGELVYNDDEGVDVLSYRRAGFVSFRHLQDRTIGTGVAGLPHLGITHVFDCKVVPGWDFRAEEEISLQGRTPEGTPEWMTPKEVRDALLSGKFTPEAGLVMLDFLYRHDLLGISMSDEQKKAMEDALHPLKDMLVVP
ncbi:uncharacterized protein B0H64DRAFT_470677 [Chaetomium fimeti]|uniref:Uncharacterized protein n=1 Tax=Chaetomium fimeti TaxID=1854472 RepID=A0AAE0LWX3_9PEZI|nr:hypothetical protein B0H64DRAFT_470677 [Chaetomium fimeti]